MGDHLTALFKLLPRGDLLPRQGDGSVLEQLLSGIADELDATESEVLSILNSLYPDQTGNFLEDWERVLGITGISVFSDVQSRVAAVVAFLTLSPESNITFFEDICAVFGYNITITRSIYKAFRAGIAKAGEQVNNPRLEYVWVVSLAVGPDEALEYIINLFKPAHTFVSFLYDSPIYTDDYIARLQGGPAAPLYNVNDLVGDLAPFVYTGNNCKKFDGQGDRAIGQTVNIGSADFELGICLKLLDTSQKLYRSYWGRWDTDGVGYSGNISIHSEGSNTTALAKGHSGTSYLTTAITRIPNSAHLGTDVFHTLAIKRVGTSLMWMLDGVSRYTATVPAEETFMVDRQLLIGGGAGASGPCLINCAWLDIAGVRVVNLTFAEGPDLTIYNQAVGGTHFTITTTSGIDTMASMDDNATPWNILNGFSLYTHATLDPIRVPYDINGDPLSITPPDGYTLESEHPSGSVHNGAESKIKGTASELIGDDLWHNGSTFVARTAAELKANNNDDDRTRVGYDSDGNIVDVPIYPAAPIGRALLYLNAYLQTLLD